MDIPKDAVMGRVARRIREHFHSGVTSGGLDRCGCGWVSTGSTYSWHHHVTHILDSADLLANPTIRDERDAAVRERDSLARRYAVRFQSEQGLGVDPEQLRARITLARQILDDVTHALTGHPAAPVPGDLAARATTPPEDAHAEEKTDA